MENSIKCHGKVCNFSLENNIRPGLLYSNKKRRDHKLYIKRQRATRPFREMADEIDISGLEHEADTNEKLNMIKGTTFSKYRTAMQNRKLLCDLKYDYARAQRACHYFDMTDELRNPLLKWFWPRNTCKDNDDKTHSESLVKKNLSSTVTDVPDSDKECQKPIELLTDDEISNWEPECEADKAEFESETAQNPSFEQNLSSTFTDDPDSDAECKKPLELLTRDEIKWRIGHIVIYLREKYSYCIWCGFQFDDEKDMQQICPGRTRQDHDGTTRFVKSDNSDST